MLTEMSLSVSLSLVEHTITATPSVSRGDEVTDEAKTDEKSPKTERQSEEAERIEFKLVLLFLLVGRGWLNDLKMLSVRLCCFLIICGVNGGRGRVIFYPAQCRATAQEGHTFHVERSCASAEYIISIWV